MLFCIDNACSRSKVALPASAKSSSMPTSPVSSDCVPWKDSSSSSCICAWRSARSSTSCAPIRSSAFASSFARREGARFAAVLAGVAEARGDRRAVFFGDVPALFLVEADLRAVDFFGAAFFAVVFLRAVVLVELPEAFLVEVLDLVRDFDPLDLDAPDRLPEGFLAALMGAGR
jgi:hypothetical protein